MEHAAVTMKRIERLSAAGAPAALLAGGVALLQWHSIRFWSAQVGATGWAWSVLLEGVALWLWYRGRLAMRLLGLIASTLLLAGPLYQVGMPLAQELGAANEAGAARARTVTLLEGRVASLKQQLSTYLDNSRSRSGWLPAIARTEHELKEAETELRALYTARRESVPQLGNVRHAVIAMQAVALLLFQVTNILALRTLAEREPRTCEREAPGAAVPALGPPATGASAPLSVPDTALPEPSARLAAVLKAWRR